MLARLRSRAFNHATVVAYLALFAAIGGGAYAAAALVGPDHVVHACVDKKGRPVIVKAGKKCHAGRRAISWNQKGQRGPRGLRGPAGKVDTSSFYTKSQSDSRFVASSKVARLDWTADPRAPHDNPGQKAEQSDTPLNFGGLELDAKCTYDNGSVSMTVSAPRPSDASIDWSYVKGGLAGTSGTPVTSDFSATPPVKIVDANPSSFPNVEHGAGTIVYRSPTSTVTLPFRYLVDVVTSTATEGPGTHCELSGNASRTP